MDNSGIVPSAPSRLGIVSVAQILTEVGRCYGKDQTHIDVATRPLDQSERKMLLGELTKSKYTIKEIPAFINSCINVVVLTTASDSEQGNLLTINCLEPGTGMGVGVSLTTLQHIMRRVTCTLRLCKEQKPMTFWVVPCDAIKEFPQQGKMVNALHVNSAFTYANGNTVFVYRKEELPKVILHETLHHICGIDSYLIWKQEHLERMFTIFNIHRETILRPNEAIVEAWAELFQMAFVATHYNMDFATLYEKELQWSLVQAKRILAKQGKRTWREETHAYSYYVIKSLFLFSPNAFLAASDKGDMTNIVDLAKKIFTSKAYGRAIHDTVLFRHRSFRMTLYGDL